MEKKLSVEILRDAESPYLDVSLVHESVGHINTLTNGALEVVGDTQLLYLTRPGENRVRPLKQYPTLPPRDIRLVLTDRPLDYPCEDGTLQPAQGIATRNTVSGGGVALVSTANEPLPHNTNLVAVHEMVHLLGMHQEGHCHDSFCIMAEAPAVDPEGKHLNDALCDPCVKALSIRAFFMVQYRNGIVVPRSWR